MTRTRMLNVAGFAVALVLAASWAVGAVWTGHHSAADAARPAHPAAATATGTPSGERVHRGAHHHHRRTGRHGSAPATAATAAGSGPSSTAAAAPTSATSSATHQATGSHTSGGSHGSGGGHQPGSGPSSQPSSPGGGSGTPTPTPSPSGNVLTGILDGLGHLGH